jgi:hypothetical protein
LARLTQIAAQEGAPMQAIGEVGGSRLSIQQLVQLPVEEIRSVWAHGLERRLNSEQ